MYFCVCCVKEDGKEKDRFLTFDDEQFEDYCLEHFDADGDGVISEWEAAKVDTIFLSQRTIKSLETISNFSNLIYLHIGKCQEIQELNLSRNQKLKHLSISYLFDLKTIDMAQCERLEYVHIQHCGKLDRLDLCNNTPQLRRLTIEYTNLTGLVLPKSETLESLVILFCGLEAIDVQRCWNVNNIEIRGTQLKSLNCGNLTELQHLSCCDNELVSLSLSGCFSLKVIRCQNNKLKELDISQTTLRGGDSYYQNPLYCAPMETLEALYLKDGWQNMVAGINKNRSPDYIPETTQILYKLITNSYIFESWQVRYGVLRQSRVPAN